MIIATAQGMLARFEEDEVRAMGRDAAGVIGIRLLKREGDQVVSMSVVQPNADLLVLTETGYGKRVRIDEFRRKHRGGQGVRLIALEGRKTGLVAAVQQVTDEDEELVLISAGGQVDPHRDPERSTATRSSARGVIVMRLDEGDSVAAISAFRPGLADARGWARMTPPKPAGRRNDPDQGSAPSVVTAFGQREARVYADQFDIYHGNANPDLARKIARWLGTECGQARGVPVREREHLRQDPGQRPREGRVHRPAHVATP